MKNDLSFLGQLSDEDKLLAGRIIDSVNACREKYVNRFTFFLNEHEQVLCRNVLASESFDNYLFFGGYENAQRRILGMFAPYSDADTALFPLKAVSFSFRKADVLTHRDFLGCLMSQGIGRNTVGDIIVSEGRAAVFIYDSVADSALLLEKIGRTGVKASEGIEDISMPKQKYLSIEGTVASLRLDSVLSVALRISREKAVGLIKSGNVQVNYEHTVLSDHRLSEGDIISAKGYGKFQLAEIGQVTKKDRTHIKINKYI